jgi:bacterioferritin-associated ferredoxin
MIVCLCRRVSDRDIHRVVAEGVTNFELLQDLTGVASNCGSCLDCAQMVFEEACAACGHGDHHVHATGLTTTTP